jgi:hypothetical protein
VKLGKLLGMLVLRVVLLALALGLGFAATTVAASVFVDRTLSSGSDNVGR